MSKRLILHIGTHKTGTSSLQSYFSFFREETERLGLGYPPIPPVFKYKFPNKQHKFLAREGFKDKNHEIVSEWLHQLKSSEHDNLLSSETFWRIGQQNNSVSRHKSGSFLTRNKKSIAKLKELLKDFDVSIHVFLRRQDLLITSLHKGAVMRGSKINELNLEEDIPILRYGEILENWTNYFGRENVNIHLYDESKNGNEGIALMARKMGLEGVYKELIPKSDISQHTWRFKPAEVEIFRECKQLLKSPKKLAIFRDDFFGYAVNSEKQNSIKKRINKCIDECIQIDIINPDWYNKQRERNLEVLDRFEINHYSNQLIDWFTAETSNVEIAKVVNPAGMKAEAQSIIGNFKKEMSTGKLKSNIKNNKDSPWGKSYPWIQRYCPSFLSRYIK